MFNKLFNTNPSQQTSCSANTNSSTIPFFHTMQIYCYNRFIIASFFFLVWKCNLFCTCGLQEPSFFFSPVFKIHKGGMGERIPYFWIIHKREEKNVLPGAVTSSVDKEWDDWNTKATHCLLNLINWWYRHGRHTHDVYWFGKSRSGNSVGLDLWEIQCRTL